MNENTICAYPFKSLALKSYNKDGSLASFWPCCMMGDPVDGIHNNNRLGISGVDKMTPAEMFAHPRMQILRENLKTGVKDPACDVCHTSQSRMYSNKPVTKALEVLTDYYSYLFDEDTANVKVLYTQFRSWPYSARYRGRRFNSVVCFNMVVA